MFLGTGDLSSLRSLAHTTCKAKSSSCRGLITPSPTWVTEQQCLVWEPARFAPWWEPAVYPVYKVLTEGCLLKLHKRFKEGRSGKDGGVGVERSWAHLPSWAHQNHNYFQKNNQWKIQEPTRKDFFFLFLGPHLQHMEVPILGVESELQLLLPA